MTWPAGIAKPVGLQSLKPRQNGRTWGVGGWVTGSTPIIVDNIVIFSNWKHKLHCLKLTPTMRPMEAPPETVSWLTFQNWPRTQRPRPMETHTPQVVSWQRFCQTVFNTATYTCSNTNPRLNQAQTKAHIYPTSSFTALSLPLVT